MSYIRLTLFLLLLQGCTTSVQTTDDASTASSKQASEEDLQAYRTALINIKDNDLTTAESSLLEFTSQHPQLAGPWTNLGLIAIRREDYKKAEEYLSTALEKNPNQPQALNLFGVVEQQKGNILKAKNYYLKAVELKQDYPVAHYNLALIYDVYLQDIPNAVAHYQKYLQLINNADQKTLDWVEELKGSLNRG